MSEQNTRRVKPYPATPPDDGFPIQMAGREEKPIGVAVAIVAGIAAAVAALADLVVELIKYA